MAKIAAVVQFYLPFVLPRADDWPSGPIGFKGDGVEVLVQPRRAGDELFPEDIDKTLSSMELSIVRLALPTGGGTRRISDSCFDRIKVEVYGEVASPDDATKAELQDRFFEWAVQVCNRFLRHCRVAAGSPYVGSVQRDYRLEDGRYYVLTPYTISWFDANDGKPVPAYEGGVNGTASSGAVRCPESGRAPFANVGASLQAGEEPDITASLLVDAEEALRSQRVREAVITLASACEIASEQYLNRAARQDDPAVRRVLNHPTLSFADKRYHEIPRIVSARSFRSESPEDFSLIENAYRTRNNVAHEGRAYYVENGSKVAVDERLMAGFLAAAGRAVRWLAALC